MAVVDPSGFDISVQIVSSRGVFPLKMGGAEQNGQSIFTGESSARFLDLPIVQSVNIELNLGMNGQVSCEIYAPFDLGIALLESELFRIGNLLQVQLGYPKIGLFLPWFSGMTIKPNFRISGDEGLTATITAQGAAFTALRTSGRVIYENKSYIEIIREIAERPYNNWNVDVPDQRQRGTVPDREDPLFRSRTSVSQRNLSDWAFLYNLCRSAACEAVLIYSNVRETRPTLRVRRRADLFSGEPVYTFVLMEQVDFVNRFPMWDFETSGEGVWMPRGNAPITFGDWNPDTQEIATGQVTQEDRISEGQRLLEETLGIGVVEEVADTETTVAGLPSEGRHSTTSSRDPSRSPEDVAAREADEDAVMGGINCSFSAFGLPLILPGSLVRVEGLGRFFSGNYLVEGMSHQASAGEWVMSIKGLTNAPGGSGAISEALRRVYDDPNRQDVPQRSEPGGGPAEPREPDGTE